MIKKIFLGLLFSQVALAQLVTFPNVRSREWHLDSAIDSVTVNGISGTVSLPTGAATSANQTNGLQKSQQVDALGNIAPVGDVNTRAPYFRLTDSINNAGITAYNHLRVTGEPQTIFFDDFDGTTVDTTNRWNAVNKTAGASLSITNSLAVFNSGTNNNDYVQITSQPTIPLAGFSWITVAAAISFEPTITTGTERFWGIGTAPTTPSTTTPVTDGVGWEITTNGMLNATIYAGGSVLYTANLASPPSDGGLHSYFLEFRSDAVFWYVDDFITPVASTTYKFPNSTNLNALIQVVNRPTGAVQAHSFNVMAFAVGDSGLNRFYVSDGTYHWRTQKVSSTGSAQVAGEGTAGTPAGGVVTVQGVDSMKPLQQLPWQSSSNAYYDAFKRLRISDNYALYDLKNIYDMNPQMVDNILAGGATATYVQNAASIDLQTTTASGDKATRRTREWIKYHPGSSQFVKVTATIGASKTNVVQRVGYFDDQNGLYFMQTGTGMNVCIRSYTSGTAVDTCTPQSSWNLDKLDGTGPSKLNFTAWDKSVIFAFDFQWLGYGRIRWMIDTGSQIAVVHEYSAVGVLDVPYMSTPDLPITWQIENVGTTASATTLRATCASVHSEGGTDLRGYKFAASNGVANTTVTTLQPILSIRPKATFGGITNRTTVKPLNSAVLNTAGGSTYCEVRYNATLTGAVWTSASTNSAVEYDTSATVATGGDIWDAYGVSGSSFQPTDLTTKQSLTLSAAATTQDTLTISCANISGQSKLAAFINWKEWR